MTKDSLQKKLSDLKDALSIDHHLPQCCEKNVILSIDCQQEAVRDITKEIRELFERETYSITEDREQLTKWEKAITVFAKTLEKEILELLVGSSPSEAKEVYRCPARDSCPYEYDTCTNPKKFCRIIEDTPEHFEKIRKEKGGSASKKENST